MLLQGLLQIFRGKALLEDFSGCLNVLQCSFEVSCAADWIGMLGALTRISIFLQRCFWELTVYIACIKGKKRASEKKGWEVKVGCTLRLGNQASTPSPAFWMLSSGTSFPPVTHLGVN